MVWKLVYGFMILPGNMPMAKGITYAVITVRSIKIFVEYVGTNMSIQVPLLVIDPERCLGHIYVVLEPVGSARLTFDDNFVLYELCDLVTECCSEYQMRSQT